MRGSAAAAGASLSSVLPFVPAFDFPCISGAQGSPSPAVPSPGHVGAPWEPEGTPSRGPTAGPAGGAPGTVGLAAPLTPTATQRDSGGPATDPPGLEGHRELPANAANPGLSSHVSPEHFDSAKENQKLRHCKPNKKQPKSPGEWLSSSPDRCHTCSDSPFSWGRQAVCSSSFRKLPKAD